MRRVSSEDLKKLYEPAPKALYDDVHAALAPLPDERKGKKVKRKIGIGFILAAALLLTAGAIAVDQWDLFRPLTRSAIPIQPLEGAEKLVETNLGGAENELVRVTVEQAVYDGQGVNVMARLTPKDPAHDALFNDWLMDAPEDLYDRESVPSEVPNGEQELDSLRVVNTPDEKGLYVDGEAVAIPASREAAEAAGLPVYLDGDVMYYADMWDYQVRGRKDGKRMLGFDVHLRSTSDNAAAASLINGMSGDAEEQGDGSVLVWFDAFADEPLSETVELRLSSTVSAEDEARPLDDVVFTLSRPEASRTARYVPENDGAIGDHTRLRDVSIRFTPVRAYLTVDFDYEERDDEPMGVDFWVFDADGHKIETGSGACYGPDQGEKLGFWRWQLEMQSLETPPDTLTLQLKVIDGDAKESCVCRIMGE